jgi:hypothetical protein
LTCIPFNLNAEAIILKLDSFGNIEWQNCYGGSGHDGVNALLEVENGFIISAYGASADGDLTGSGWHGNSDIWIIKIDFWGNIIWQKCYGGSRYESALNVFSTTDNHLVIIGTTESKDGDITNNHSISEYSNDIWVLKINNEGDIITQKCFGGAGNDFIMRGALQKSDNNYVIAAYTNYGPSYDVGCTPYGGNGDIDYWVFEIMLDDTTNVIEPVASTTGITVYPNPASQWVAFNYALPANAKQEEIKITDAKGAMITSFTVTGSQGQQIWDTRSLKSGVYFYTLSVGEFTKSGKIVINK